ncbi:MAG: flagellar basal body-associated protein FliL [Bdellovibrionales bacterium]
MAEQKAAAPAEPTAEKPVEAKAQKPILFIILSIVNMLVVAGVGVMLYLGKKKETAQPTIEDVIEGEHHAQAHEGKQEEEFIGTMIPMETFLVNLAGSRGGKLAKVNMELEVDGAKVQEEIEKRKPQIRDIIITLLSSKTYEQVSTKEGKEALREDVRDTVNSFLTKGKIKKIFFTEFIVN